MICYRADRRDLQPKQRISRERCTYFKYLNASQQKLEQIFECFRPLWKRPRNCSLFTFVNKKKALQYWLKHRNYKLYECRVARCCISHCGSYDLVEQAFLAHNDSELENIARRYWRTKPSNTNEAELLTCCRIRVTRVLSSDEQLRNDIYDLSRGFGKHLSQDRLTEIDGFLRAENIAFKSDIEGS